MMKPARPHMPGNRDAMPHAGTDAETRAVCLDARARCVRHWDAVIRTFRSTTVTHVNKLSDLQIHSRQSCSQTVHWFIIDEWIKYNIHLCVLWSSKCPAASCGYLADIEIEKLVTLYTVIMWLRNVHTSYVYHTVIAINFKLTRN